MPDRPLGEPPLRVVIADDSYLVREGTRRLLEATNAVQVIATVGSGPELLDAAGRLVLDAVVADIRMPPGHAMEGIEAAHEIRSRHPCIGVVILSQYADPSYALALFENGTAGLAYLLKDRIGDSEEIIRALRAVVIGDSVIDPLVVEGLVTRRARIAQSPLRHLTPREIDVLGGMAAGRTNAAIADHLVVSESSVSKHVNSIFAKLGLTEETQTHRRVAAVLTFLADRAE